MCLSLRPKNFTVIFHDALWFRASVVGESGCTAGQKDALSFLGD